MTLPPPDNYCGALEEEATCSPVPKYLAVEFMEEDSEGKSCEIEGGQGMGKVIESL